MDFLEILKFLGGMLLFVFVVPAIPWVIDSLTNNPNRHRLHLQNDARVGTVPTYPNSTFGFFTYLQPGRVKMIERGNRFMRAIMRYSDHVFQGEVPGSGLQMREIAYWEITESSRHGGSDPIPFPGKKWLPRRGARGLKQWLRFLRWVSYSPLSILFWLWKEWVYLLTGAIFTGIYPFQVVRVYPIERFKKVTEQDGTIRLERIVDYSDHYRVADFQLPIIVPKADTKDKLPVSVLINQIGMVNNPYKTAYNTDDDWTTRLLSSVSSVVTAFTRTRPLDEVLSAKDSRQAAALGKRIVKEGNKSAIGFGVTFTESQILDISPVNVPADGSVQSKLSDVALARIDREAAEERAIGKAADTREQGKALKDYPGAQLVPEIEGRVRSAEAAGKAGGTVILNQGGGQSLDPVQVASLQVLQDLAGKRRGRPAPPPPATPPTTPP